MRGRRRAPRSERIFRQRGGGVAPLRGRAQAEVGRAFDDEQARPVPSPCSWTMSVPLKLSVEASSAAAARSSASARRSAGGYGCWSRISRHASSRLTSAPRTAARSNRKRVTLSAKRVGGHGQNGGHRGSVGSSSSARLDRNRVERHRQARSCGRTSAPASMPARAIAAAVLSFGYSACIAPSANSRPEPTDQKRLYSNTSRIE